MSDLDALIERFGLNTPTEVTPIEGGLTNTNHLVTIDGERFVVRVVGRNAVSLGIDRTAEAQAARRAAEAGIGAEVVGLLPEGHMVTRFIEGKGFSEEAFGSEAVVRRVGATLARVHALEPIPGVFDPTVHIDHRLTIVASREGPVPGGLVEGVRRVAEIVARRVAEPRVLCHNDPYFTNFIDDGSSLRLIDWEYAGMGDALYDLAGVAYALDAPKRVALLDAYDGRVDDRRLKDLSDLVMVFLLWNVAWALVQIDDSDVDYDYEAMALDFVGLMEREAWST